MSVTPNAGCVDVVIVGAGISGLGAAYRIIERNPQLTYTILERRARIGGTWDLFRYPGVRSDSSIFTLSFPYEPWTREEGIADGAHIREYLTDMAHKYGIDRHIEFNLGIALSTRRTCSKTCPTCSGVWVTRTRPGRCAPT